MAATREAPSPACSVRMALLTSSPPSQICSPPCGSEAELHVQLLGDVGVAGLVVGRQARALPGIGHEAIQRAAVQQLPAEPVGDQARDRALARAARPVDGDDGDALVDSLHR